MPARLNHRFFKKKVLVNLALIFVGLGVYLNLAYAHIFDYDKSRQTVSIDIQRHYFLNDGKGKDSIKYVALGDSLTYGFGAINYQRTFPYILANKLLQNHKQVEVINLAVPGATSFDVINNQIFQASAAEPDFVTLMIGTNDVHNFVSKQVFKGNLIALITKLKTNTKTQILLINIPYLGTKDLILPPYDTIMDARIKEYNKVIEEAALNQNIKYFDLYTASKKPFMEHSDYLYSIDHFHPSGEGYTLWGNLINVD